MKIKTKYNLGQDVYTIIHLNKQIKEKCPVCNGTGHVTLNGNQYQCPECYGQGIKVEWTSSGWTVDQSSQIGRIDVSVKDDVYKESYMLKYSGIDSGTIWDVGDLFSTREEAEKECEKRNEEICDK